MLGLGDKTIVNMFLLQKVYNVIETDMKRNGKNRIIILVL